MSINTAGPGPRALRAFIVAAALCLAGGVVAAEAAAATGDLTQKPGTAGCISNSGSGGACADGTALDFPSSVTVSPDGASATWRPSTATRWWSSTAPPTGR